jgi:hypothetical protein
MCRPASFLYRWYRGQKRRVRTGRVLSRGDGAVAAARCNRTFEGIALDERLRDGRAAVAVARSGLHTRSVMQR